MQLGSNLDCIWTFNKKGVLAHKNKTCKGGLVRSYFVIKIFLELLHSFQIELISMPSVAFTVSELNSLPTWRFYSSAL